MAQPPDFAHPDFPHHVCRLHRSIYGLKQSPRAWFQRLHDFLLSIGFFNSRADSSLFIRHSGSSTVAILVYVDDFIVTGSSTPEVNKVIDSICETFESRRLGPLGFFLGIETHHSDTSLILNQSKYAFDLLRKFKMEGCKLASTPLIPGSHLSSNDGDPLPNPTTYRSMVGGLQYLTLTHPDISFVVNQVCQHMYSPRTTHLVAVKRILKFIKGTINLGLRFSRSTDTSLRAYSDSNWAGSVDNRKSTTGACIFIGPNLVAWTTKKQTTVARSSSEAEYRALVTSH